MVDAPLMAQLLDALPDERISCSWAMPISSRASAPGAVLHDLIASGEVPVVKLTEIFRQAAQSRIITTAHDINRGAVPDLKSRAGCRLLLPRAQQWPRTFSRPSCSSCATACREIRL